MRPAIEICSVDPRAPDVLALIEALDALMLGLYPLESAHLTDPELLADERNLFLGGFVDGCLRGCGGMILGSEPDYGEVKRIFVHPKVRGMGLARGIIERLEHHARARGLAALKLETGIHQPEALSLFVACGFSECERFGSYPEGDPHSVFFEKLL